MTLLHYVPQARLTDGSSDDNGTTRCLRGRRN